MRRDAWRPLVVLVGLVVAGALLGVLWSQLVWTPPPGTVQGGQWFPLDERALSLQTRGTSSYVLVAAVGGLLLGVLAALVGTRRELLTLLAVVLGGAVAAYVMWQVGTWLGPADPVAVAADAPDGTSVPGALTVAGATPFLTLPAAALAGLAAVFFVSPDAGRDKSAPQAPPAR
ncbi:hypothetical protein [Nocardioides sp. AX2bis]|uniref:hypothetical protein n=1 Tax=Nocardioides sp. AX2bis TaxID=2653157 RepID=UPI0012F42924|nr:hypothetical protein [Nocardioides sp. AX2bis]VXB71570.1 conserved membrane hypothetical protein [Nocardioides sp. AX2bis]